MRELLGSRSLLLISHRFSTVRAGDRMSSLDAAEVIEAGRHAAPWRAAGVRRAVGLQASAYAG
jgi:ATP-binding cassette subfamily B protein